MLSNVEFEHSQSVRCRLTGSIHGWLMTLPVDYRRLEAISERFNTETVSVFTVNIAAPPTENSVFLKKIAGLFNVDVELESFPGVRVVINVYLLIAVNPSQFSNGSEHCVCVIRFFCPLHQLV